MDAGRSRPVPLVGQRTFGADRKRRAQSKRMENRIENVAAHIALGPGSEIDPFAPVYRVIIALADVRAFGADAQPQVPIEPVGNGVRGIGPLRRIAPCFGAPGMDFFDFADDTVLD